MDGALMQRLEGLFRRGELAAARTEGEAALRLHPEEPALLHLLGVTCCFAGDFAGGAHYLEALLERQPDNLRGRIDLANARLMVGDTDGALALCTGTAPEIRRLKAYVLQSRGDDAGAASAYEEIVAANPGDWETWNNLGTARRALGDLPGSIDALLRARSHRGDLAPIHLNLAASLAEAGRMEESLAAYREAARLDPSNAGIPFETGKLLRHMGRFDDALEPLRDAAAAAPKEAGIRVELGRCLLALHRVAEAEAAYREAAALAPDSVEAWLELGLLLERDNRLDALEAMLGDLPAPVEAAPQLHLLRATLLRRRGRPRDALELARAAPPDVEPVRRAALIGKLADRLGDSEGAFSAFEEMNRLIGEQAGDAVDPARYRRHVEALSALMTPDWYATWTARAPGADPSPVFLVGFPRSGTTLLDTLLMGHPDLLVLEEEPILQRVADALGDFDRLPGLDDVEIERLRNLYLAGVAELAPEQGGRRVVDKLPLNLLGAPLIHRLFPDAPIVFAARHPCDVVLSNFMQDFELNDAMANFLRLEDAARLYDLVLGFWERCTAALPLRVHPVRYEDVVADAEKEMRSLLTFLDLPWDERVLDHRRTAAERGTISTPSYAQVTEPIYADASGRWLGYRQAMADVLPILAPWVERLGYGPAEAVAPA